MPDDRPRDRDAEDEVTRIAHVLPPSTVRAWRALAPVVPRHAYLAGDTAIAVHLGHRISRDLDFFTEQRFDPEALATEIDGVGNFAASMIDRGTLNGVFEETKVQFLDASSQRLIEEPSVFGGVRVAHLPDLLATKLKVIQDRGALRDYFDIMVIEQATDLTVEEGLSLLVEKYRPRAPEGVIASVVRGLGYLDDVEGDPSLPQPRGEIEAYWRRRQPEVLKTIR